MAVHSLGAFRKYFLISKFSCRLAVAEEGEEFKDAAQAFSLENRGAAGTIQ